MIRSTEMLVVALGGNALARSGDDGSVTMQYERATEALAEVAELVADGARIVLTHGNGPVVGNIVLRGELACDTIPPTPLFIAGADSEGGIGLMLQQVLGNRLRAAGCARPVVSIVTQCVVDASDPAFASPSKPIGPSYSAPDAQRLASERGWTVAEEPGRGWRRVVASPRPLRIVEDAAVSALLDADCVPIAAGGGGVPVVEQPDGSLRGVDAVIDKDWASALLASALGVDRLAILMEADAVYRDYGTPDARRIERLRPDEATALAESLSHGSIGPKLAACAWFARSTGGEAVICATGHLHEALAGASGTRISAT